jgi:hypothetical protein
LDALGVLAIEAQANAPLFILGDFGFCHVLRIACLRDVEARFRLPCAKKTSMTVQVYLSVS